MKLKKAFLTLTTIVSIQNGLLAISNATDLNNAIISGTGGTFTTSFNYAQLFQPFNTDNVLTPTINTFTIDGAGFTLTQTGSF